MGFSLITAGFILLFNPVFYVIDVIPDALGFFLIAAGLAKLSCFVEKIAQARGMFLKLAYVEIAKMFSLLLIPYNGGSDKILYTFVFTVVELLMFIPALNWLFEGFGYTGIWYSATALYAKHDITKNVKRDGKRQKNVVRSVDAMTRAKTGILVFYIVRVAATLIPELTELQLYDYLGEVTALGRSAVYYKPFLYVLMALIVLIWSISYIRRVCGFFGSLKKDKPYMDELTRKYEFEILPNGNFFTARNMKRVLMLMFLASAASFMPVVDGINLFVGAASSALLIAAALILKQYAKAAVFIIPLAAVRGVLAVVNLITQIRYFAEYNAMDAKWISGATERYYSMAMTEVIEYIIALASFLFFIAVLMKAVKNHLEITGIETDNAMYSKRNRDIEIYNVVGSKLLLSAVLTIINFIMYCAYHYLIVEMEAIGVITIIISLIWIAYMLHTVTSIGNLIYNKELERF